ncbi:AAA family ATPase [Jatrophihabitans telluris]|uniref:AAA family ATPase n=1 Tax=Jatrophihabitans telluris TaxID=2038343 RepID=A0ABY4QX25_9ACTN|nr:AAA family ATPase [Jatrophihabitans telluris]UQX87465.1 AAA family ATPase [Jatrophihabitans telluris]
MLEETRRGPTAGTPAARAERDAFATLHADQLARLRAVSDRLAFGRLDLLDGSHHHIGRIGLANATGARILIDWRAPAAEPFYQATPADPQGVLSRRHLTTSGRRVTAISDEILDYQAFTDEPRDETTVSDEGALMLALNAHRTGQMRDIVSTIQAEQDRIVRDQLAGILVVQGGPGTGKTAVALHRAAYLLYAHRQRLERSGVLLVGPNRRFLHYIEQVLPSLGETGVVMATPGELFPGVSTVVGESAEVERLKGSGRMIRVVSGAVRARQRLPRKSIPLKIDGTTVLLTENDAFAARQRARNSRKPHNEARTVFVVELLELLVQRYAKALDIELTGTGSADTRAELVTSLRDSRDVRREINLLWMPLTPQQLLTELYSDPGFRRAATGGMSERDRQLLHREAGEPWSVADVALLDEAAELLGEDDAVARAAAARRAAERVGELEFAEQSLETFGAVGAVTADDLVDRYAGQRERRTVAEHAAGDRSWAYGHIVVDEAQELSAMQWRMLMRRCPTRSMTLVGDPAQTSSSAGATNWGQVLDRYVRDRWRLSQLSVNYRTPRVVMDDAIAVMTAAGIGVGTLTSAREGHQPPVVRRVELDLIEDVVMTALAEQRQAAGGSVAVIVPAGLQAAIEGALSAAVDEGSPEIVVLTAGQAKGLEFDSVLVVEPAAIVAERRRGVNDLYVAMSRPTQRLTVLHERALPAGLVDR